MDRRRTDNHVGGSLDALEGGGRRDVSAAGASLSSLFFFQEAYQCVVFQEKRSASDVRVPF